ncbi:hypothetical protein SBV1_790018 [Verrucomicrobia bacterium]|nr:hypothetical protein SBV1_790018 [Verrucomicrobiota bacterium]
MFLSCGKDYHGLPESLEGYVYIYGPRQSRERGNGNRLYLVRAPRNRLRERSAYQFFQRTDAAGTSVWTSDSIRAQPIFTDPNGVAPGAVVYAPTLKRFLLTGFHVGPSQLGVFDAPNPWGPWTTIAFVGGPRQHVADIRPRAYGRDCQRNRSQEKCCQQEAFHDQTNNE